MVSYGGSFHLGGKTKLNYDKKILFSLSVDTFVEEKASKWATSNPVRLDLSLEYTTLPTISTEVEKEVEKPSERVTNGQYGTACDGW